jgi:hypothetical protein
MTLAGCSDGNSYIAPEESNNTPLAENTAPAFLKKGDSRILRLCSGQALAGMTYNTKRSRGCGFFFKWRSRPHTRIMTT